MDYLRFFIIFITFQYRFTRNFKKLKFLFYTNSQKINCRILKRILKRQINLNKNQVRMFYTTLSIFEFPLSCYIKKNI